MSGMFVVKDLKFKFESNLNFELICPYLSFEASGITAIRGPSGCGKSTFFRILIGEFSPKNWLWTLNNEELSSKNVGDRQLGVVFQNYELFPNLTAFENIEIVMKARRHFNEVSLQQLDSYKKQLNLQKCWTTKAQNLSGGEKQRTAVLRAIMSNPKLILLDEPFAALDPELRQESRKILKDVIVKSGVPALMITHDEVDCTELADRIIFMKDGRFQG
jgi:ABC-type sugar transport system ATPase subunit